MKHQKIKYGFESEAAREFPPYLMYDVLNMCNARCAHCPQSIVSKSPSFRPMRISWEHYEKSIREAADYEVDVVRLTGDGEPLLHPDIVRMVSLAKECGFPMINLTTNGSLLKSDLLDALLENPPHVFDISLDALWLESYQEVRAGLDFEQVKNNVFRLLEVRDQEKTKVLVSMIRRPGSDEEVEAFKEYWGDKVDYVAIREMHTNLGTSGEISVSTDKERWPCQHLWQRLVVDYRGYIRYCPVDWEGASKIGTIDTMTLYNAWHSPAMGDLRKKHLAGQFKDCEVCGGCRDWLVSPWDRGWLRLVRGLEDD